MDLTVQVDHRKMEESRAEKKKKDKSIGHAKYRR